MQKKMPLRVVFAWFEKREIFASIRMICMGFLLGILIS